MQAPPPGIANMRAQQGAEADGDPHVQSHNAERHPFRAVMAGEWNEQFIPAKMRERIEPDSQDMHTEKDGTEKCQKVMQFVIYQPWPAAGRLELCRKRQARDHRQHEQDIGGKTARPRDVPGHGLPESI
jgi:hypothetical protein